MPEMATAASKAVKREAPNLLIAAHPPTNRETLQQQYHTLSAPRLPWRTPESSTPLATHVTPAFCFMSLRQKFDINRLSA
jgi:hypothetical protein